MRWVSGTKQCKRQTVWWCACVVRHFFSIFIKFSKIVIKNLKNNLKSTSNSSNSKKKPSSVLRMDCPLDETEDFDSTIGPSRPNTFFVAVDADCANAVPPDVLKLEGKNWLKLYKYTIF